MVKAGTVPLPHCINSFVNLFLEHALKSVEYNYSNHFFIVSILRGGIFWIWSIISLVATDNMKPYLITIWLIIAMTVPGVRAQIPQIVQQRRNKIAVKCFDPLEQQ